MLCKDDLKFNEEQDKKEKDEEFWISSVFKPQFLIICRRGALKHVLC